MSALFSPAEAEEFAKPHVNRCWFGRFDLPFGISYLYNGTGSIEIGGNSYRGLSDPNSARLVSVGEIDEPQFGQAAVVEITLTGVNRAFLQELHATRAELEGRRADIMFGIFDGETMQLKTALFPIFPFGRLTSPEIRRQGIGTRTVSLYVEGIWQAMNYAQGGRWTSADQQRRFPGDLGWDYAGQDFVEYWQ